MASQQGVTTWHRSVASQRGITACYHRQAESPQCDDRRRGAGGGLTVGSSRGVGCASRSGAAKAAQTPAAGQASPTCEAESSGRNDGECRTCEAAVGAGDLLSASGGPQGASCCPRQGPMDLVHTKATQAELLAAGEAYNPPIFDPY